MTLTKEDKLALKILVKKELHQIEKEGQKYKIIEVNSPALSSLLLKDKDITFLATQKRYHQFLKKLEKKL